MKILLIGGTGTISMALSRLLLSEGHELWLVNRGGKRNALLPGDVHLIQCDSNDEEAMAKLLPEEHFDAVANFVAFVPAQVERDIRLFSGKTSQYLFISSASAYQKPLSHYVVTESTPLSNPYWQYSRDKIACEETLMRAYREQGFPVTIVRPSHTYDERSVPVGLHGHMGSAPVLRRMLTGKAIPVHGDGSSLWTFTHNTDFARGFAGLLGNPHAIGEAVHITSDESLTWNQAYRIIAAALGVEPVFIYVPSVALAAEGKAFGFDFEGSLLGDKANSVVFDNSKIKRLCPGFCAVKRYDQGVREALCQMDLRPEAMPAEEAFDRFCDKLSSRFY